MTLFDRLGSLRVSDRVLSFLGWAVLLAAAFWLRLPHFSPLAMQFDEVEYAYCIETNQFPHSPYLLFLWMGWLMKPFVSLDWGFSALSMTASLATVYLIGSTARTLSGSRWAGWMAGLVMALMPIALRVAGKQEVYAFQLLLLALAWHLAVCRRWVLPSGIALGAAFAAHNGTLFALPGSLALFYFAWRERSLDNSGGDGDKERHSRESGNPEGPSNRDSEIPVHSVSTWGRLGIGFAAPVVMVLSWIVGIWINFHGIDQLHLLPVYLKGNSPPPDFSLVLPEEGEAESIGDWIGILREKTGDQLERFWEDMAGVEVIPRGAILFGFVGLLLLPWRKSLPWLLLPLPYLAYEFAAGWTLDPGIYSVYVLPSIACSAGLLLAQTIRGKSPSLRALVSGICLLGVLASIVIALPTVQERQVHRNLQPWRIAEGGTMTLAKWVRENTSKDAIVEVPAEWFYCGLAIPYYAGRIPMFRDGYILRPQEWRPMYADYRFNHLEKVTDEKFDEWIDAGRPLLSFDPNPFEGFGANWGGIDVGRLEVRPILWLDRNPTGTSRFWREAEIQAEIEPHLIDDKERRPHFYIDESFPTGEMEGTVFHPTLYRICRKSDPPDPPQWVLDLQSKVPESQWGAPPVWKGKGLLFTDGASFYSPAVPGEDHAVRARIHTRGQEYALRCEVRYDGDWLEVGRDVEKWVPVPPEGFVDLVFHIPGRYVEKDNLRLRLSPAFDTKFVNLFHLAVAKTAGQE